MKKVGIIGVTGYAGEQLLWILNQHPDVEVVALSSRSYANQDVSAIFPNFYQRFSQILLDEEDFIEKIPTLDLLFMALPHGLSQELALIAHKAHVKVVDLGADFRFDSVETYEHHYKASHIAKDLNKEAIYGMPELYRDAIKEAKIVASPGCYPTSAILGSAPLLSAEIVNPKTIVIDAKSGTTGAGRSNKTSSLYCEVNESFKAYGIFSHRHQPEIEQELSKQCKRDVEVIFTPHLLPLNRGILSTIYFDLTDEHYNEEKIYALYEDFYQDEPFIRIRKDLPELNHIARTNLCDIAIRVDQKRQKVIVISAIDNLIKGAAGQAVQNMNLMFGLNEREGLDFLSMYI